jgi:hypothetical protein
MILFLGSSWVHRLVTMHWPLSTEAVLDVQWRITGTLHSCVSGLVENVIKIAVALLAVDISLLSEARVVRLVTFGSDWSLDSELTRMGQANTRAVIGLLRQSNHISGTFYTSHLLTGTGKRVMRLSRKMMEAAGKVEENSTKFEDEAGT